MTTSDKPERKMRGRVRSPSSERRDGFVWELGYEPWASLYNFLYNYPPGRRRQMMMDLMVKGYEELGRPSVGDGAAISFSMLSQSGGGNAGNADTHRVMQDTRPEPSPAPLPPPAVEISTGTASVSPQTEQRVISGGPRKMGALSGFKA